MTGPRVPCVGAIVLDEQRRLLVILRGQAPSAGTWSIPGGRLEPDESPTAGCAREVLEETGLVVDVGSFVGRVERAAPDGSTYVIDDFRATLAAGHATEPVCGDDAAAARWVRLDELLALPTAPGLVEALSDWGCLPD